MQVLSGQVGIKISLIISLGLILFGFFGGGVLAKFSKDYESYNRSKVAEAYKEADKKNVNDVVYTLLINIRSNELYSKSRKAADALSFLGLILFVLTMLKIEEMRVNSFKNMISGKKNLYIDEKGNLKNKNDDIEGSKIIWTGFQGIDKT